LIRAQFFSCRPNRKPENPKFAADVPRTGAEIVSADSFFKSDEVGPAYGNPETPTLARLASYESAWWPLTKK